MNNYELTGDTQNLKTIDYLVYRNKSKNDFGFNYVYPTNLKQLLPTTEIIDYISVLPGVGKTHWARKKMVKGSINKDYIYLFIAPTIKLLREVYKDLKKVLNPETNCNIFCTDNDINDFNLTDQFLDTLNLAKKGDIILITHALYLSLPELDDKQKQKIFVIFDEAQMIGVKSCDITLDQKDLEYFRSNTFLEVIPSDSRPKNIKGNIDDSYIEKYFRVHGNSTVVSNYKKRGKDSFNKDFYTLLKNSISPKLNVYVMPKGKQLSFFSFTSPKHSFKGFAKIYLMGAFFNLSELFHILTREGHILRDMSTKVNLDRQTKIRERFMGLSVLPILKLDKHLSLNLIKRHLAVKKGLSVDELVKDFSDVYRALEEKMSKVNNSDFKYKKISSVLKSVFLGSSYHSEVDELVKPLKDRYGTKLYDVFEHLINICVKNVKFKSTPLLVTNVLNKNYVHKDQDFEIITPNVHGLNKYKDKDTLIFMAALNPTPTLNLFYSHFIPDFKHESHIIAANVIQAVCRLNLRNIKCKKDTLLIVPTTQTANLIRKILKPYLVIETIECLDPITKIDFLSFSGLIKLSNTGNKKKSYLVEKKKGDLLETRLTTEAKFKQYPEYKKISNEYIKISMNIKRFDGDKNAKEFEKMLKKKRDLTNQKKALRTEIAKREGFKEYKPR